MKQVIDTNFARALLILVGALVIFSFWFLTEDMRNSYDKASVSTAPQPGTENRQDQIIEGGTSRQVELADPVLQEVVIGDFDSEVLDDVEELDDIAELGDIDFTDIDF